jgi:hypothetical protein
MEQRVYLETTSGDRSVKKTTTKEGDAMYITLSEVDLVVGRAVERYTSPIDQIFGTEEMMGVGFTKKAARLDTVLDIVDEGNDNLTPLKL